MKGVIIGIFIGLLVSAVLAGTKYGINDGIQRVIYLLEQIEINTRKV